MMLVRTLPFTKQFRFVRCLTYYEVLGVPRTATKAEIKQAYLEKAKECHPDLNPDNVKAAVLFQELQEAQDTLMDSQLRAQYNSQINQESYFGSQQTHQPVEQRRKSSVQSHGFKAQYNSRKSDRFHENHRVNQDNYQHPGTQRKHKLRREPTDDDEDVFPNQDAVMSDKQMVMLGLAFIGVALVGVISKLRGETEEGGNLAVYIDSNTASVNKSSESPKSTARDSKSVTEPRRYVYNAEQDATVRDIPKPKRNLIERPGKPDQDIVRYVWSDEKDNLVPMRTLKNGHGGGSILDLKDKFDAKMQTNLGDIKVEENLECDSNSEERGRITLTDIRLMKKELSKKKSEYLNAKAEYTEKLELYRADLREKKEKQSENIAM